MLKKWTIDLTNVQCEMYDVVLIQWNSCSMCLISCDGWSSGGRGYVNGWEQLKITHISTWYFKLYNSLGNGIHFVIYTNILYLNEMNRNTPGLLNIVLYNSYHNKSFCIYLTILHINALNGIHIKTNNAIHFVMNTKIHTLTKWIAFYSGYYKWYSTIHIVTHCLVST